MRSATLIVEQVDRAATELAVDHPLNARIALILIDNAAELIIHRRCERLVRADQRSAAPTLTAAKRQSVEDAHETFWGWVRQQEDAAQDARGRFA